MQLLISKNTIANHKFFFLNQANQKVSKQPRKETKWYFNIQFPKNYTKSKCSQLAIRKKSGYMKRFQITNFSIFAKKSKVPVQCQLWLDLSKKIMVTFQISYNLKLLDLRSTKFLEIVPKSRTTSCGGTFSESSFRRCLARWRPSCPCTPYWSWSRSRRPAPAGWHSAQREQVKTTVLDPGNIGRIP